MPRSTTKQTVATARRLRRSMTLPEVLLWRILRTSPDGIKFRRQHPLGPYVIDFYCPSAKLGIEVDGIAHDMGDGPERDEERSALIAGRGVRLLRVPAADVLRSVDQAAEAIVLACRAG